MHTINRIISFILICSVMLSYMHLTIFIVNADETTEEITTEVYTDETTVSDDTATSNETVVDEAVGGDEEILGASDFEAYLTEQGFPDSYKPYLVKLHEAHPSWTFKAIQTNIEWSTLIANEINTTGQIKNLVYCSSAYPNYNWRSMNVGYDSTTNTWYPYDGYTWYAASDALVTYYLDPRNYLYETYVFAFESLSYRDGIQNQTGVEAILTGTFMANATDNVDGKLYSELIMNAAKESGVSPYHLASRIKQEMGTTATMCALGTSTTYPGIYNYFNIGAYDVPKGSAALNGLKWAAASGTYDRPWTSPAKAITGGAKYLASSFISKGQDTLYTQKFNVTYTDYLFKHQYMTNVQAAASEASMQYSAYASKNLLDTTIQFEIPVYLNMPSTAVAKPSANGNSNAYLESLSVDSYSLTPSFSYSTLEYSLIVGSDVSSVNISATPVVSSSSVTGTGKVNLSEGTNTFTINVTSDTGNVTNYTLTIIRGKSASTEATTSTTTEQSTTAAETVRYGDMNGDGKISALDIVKLQRLIVGLDDTTDDVLKLGDVNGDGKISALDIVKLQRHIVGLETIEW